MNKKFIREVLKLAPDLSVVDQFFYIQPVDHILCGFLCERPTTSAYFWKYIFPLYVRFDFLHLAFGDRLPPPDGSMEARRGMEKKVAEEFVKRIEPYVSEMASVADSLDRCVEYIESLQTLGNLHIRRGYAYTLILLDRAEEARTHLEVIVSSDEMREYPERYSDVPIVLRDLSVGLEAAKGTLMQWELETKRTLGLVRT